MMTAETDAQENLGKEWNWFEKHMKRNRIYQLTEFYDVIWGGGSIPHSGVSQLARRNYPRRAAMCAELIDQIESANLINKILFSDVATFHTCGKVNRHNCCIWADKKPPNFLEWERDTSKVNVWLGMTQSKVYGPFFFAEATVTGPVYLDMLEQLIPQTLNSYRWHS